MRTSKIAALLFVLFLIIPRASYSANADSTFRAWGYLNYTLLFSPDWVFTIMPGYSYEFSRNDADSAAPHGAQSSVLNELYFGPAYVVQAGEFTLKLPFWYSFQGYPTAYRDMYHFSHNLDFLPVIQFTHNGLELITRLFLENKFHTTRVPEGSNKQGYSLQFRPLVRVNYWLTSSVALTLADEAYLGLVQDSNNKSGPEPGFARKGFSENRFMAGMEYKFSPFTSIAPQYMLRTLYDPASSHKLLGIDHCAFIQFNYIVRL
ncbi:MAG: DUF2490 domain-containing protein [Spirochaetes bacterium]|nr:MAG: DUF2490 domain-containing protein [Spirochaetota bacterium]